MTPPRILRAVISASLPHADGEPLLQELDALYAARVTTRGRAAANFWYARQALGFVLRVGGERAANGLAGPDSLRADLVVALRSARRRPAFAVAFVLTLAVGTGVLTTVYTAARWVLLRPVPGVTEPDALVTLRLGAADAPPFVSFDVSQPDLMTLRDRLPVAGALAGSSAVQVDLRAEGSDPRRVAAELVTANYFAVLQAPLAAGRSFVASDDNPTTGDPSVILSYRLAAAVSAGDPLRAAGGDVRVNGAKVHVIGVATPGFRGAELPGRADAWFTIAALHIIDPSVGITSVSNRGSGVWRRIYLRPPASVSVSQVASAANLVMAAVRQEFKGQMHSYLANSFQFQAFPGIGLDPSVRSSVRRTLTLLAGAAALLLLLAIANLANLTLVQSTLRGSATAIRFALGASRGRILRGLLVETLLLGAAGGAVALVIAFAWSRWFQGAQLSERGGALAGMHIDPWIAAITLVLALVAAVLAFAGPARLVGMRSLEQLMRRGSSGTRATHRVRSTLVATQVALSVVLLVCAALLGRTVANLRRVDLGFDPARLLAFSVDPHLHGYESASLDRFARDIERRLRDNPAVAGAAFISPAPLESGYVTAALFGSDDPEKRPLVGAGYYVSPGFLSALRVRVLAGDANWQADSGTVVISRVTLEKLWPGVTPAAAVGRLVPTREKGKGLVRIAAVIENLNLSDITGSPPPVILRPLAERHRGLSMSGFVAVNGAPLSIVPALRQTMAEAAPELPLFDIRTARQAVDLQFAERDTMARTASTLSAIGLLLAVIGLFGVLSHLVASRRREIGVRSALGASPVRIVRGVVVGGLAPVVAGLVVGLAAAFAGSKLLSAQLFQLERFDPPAYVGAVLSLLLAAMVACAVPAWRALRVSPVEVLREE